MPNRKIERAEAINQIVARDKQLFDETPKLLETLKSKRLRWSKGVIPNDGFYLVYDLLGEIAEHVEFLHKGTSTRSFTEWAKLQ